MTGEEGRHRRSAHTQTADNDGRAVPSPCLDHAESMGCCKAREHKDENDGADEAGVVLVELVRASCHDLSSRLVSPTLLALEVG